MTSITMAPDRPARRLMLTPPDPRSPTIIRWLLVPIDLSPDALDRLQPAISLARRFDAKLVLVHVSQLPFSFCYARGPYAYVDCRRHRLDLENLLLQLRDRLRLQYPRCDAFLLDGTDVAATAVAAAEKLEVDLIVVPARDWFSRSHKNATAEAIIRRAHRPVLVVPGKKNRALELWSHGYWVPGIQPTDPKRRSTSLRFDSRRQQRHIQHSDTPIFHHSILPAQRTMRFCQSKTSRMACFH
jgi:nucleotide-binding universal stress UspA family protein